MSQASTKLRAAAAALCVAALAALAGCAPLPPPQPAGTPGTPSQKPAPPSVPGQPSRPTAAQRDSLPSPDALRVLATIPEPLPESQRVPPPGAPSPDSTGGKPAPAVVDTSAREAPADTSAVPVPTPVEPLGDRPGSAGATLPESLGVAAAARADSILRAARAASPDSCWRLQVGAPSEKSRAETIQRGAQSLLDTPMVVEREAGRFKVRSRDCYGHDAAFALRSRALHAGFEGAFVFPGKR